MGDMLRGFNHLIEVKKTEEVLKLILSVFPLYFSNKFLYKFDNYSDSLYITPDESSY